MTLNFNASLKRVSTDSDGESVVQFSIPLEDLGTIAKLSEGAVGKLLRVTVDVE